MPLTARRLGICGCCGCRTPEATALWWVPQTGLARHRACKPSDDYLRRYEAWVQDEVKAAQREVADLVATTLAILSEPRRVNIRRHVIAALIEV